MVISNRLSVIGKITPGQKMVISNRLSGK